MAGVKRDSAIRVAFSMLRYFKLMYISRKNGITPQFERFSLFPKRGGVLHRG